MSDSAFRKQRQNELYLKQMGEEALARQQAEATKAKGGCVCNWRMVKKRWDGDVLSARKVHEPSCRAYKWWMAEA